MLLRQYRLLTHVGSFILQSAYVPPKMTPCLFARSQKLPSSMLFETGIHFQFTDSWKCPKLGALQIYIQVKNYIFRECSVSDVTEKLLCKNS